MFDTENSVVVIIDIQEKLVNAVKDNSPVNNACKIAKAAKILGIPVIVTEQYPKGLGTTVQELKENLPENTVYVEKTCFSAMDNEAFYDAIVSTGRNHVVVFGIETHICVYQTVCDLLKKYYDVQVVKDACAARKPFEAETGLDLIKQNGAFVTCVETLLFEWLKSAEHKDFKQIQNLIKEC